jgi:2-keto-4-pentenoate hydratase
MTLTAAQRSRVALLLRTAEQHRHPVGRISLAYPALDVEDAYAIQQENLTHRLGKGGVPAGRKIGLTSQAMQRLLGVGEPDYGYLLDTMIHADRAVLDPAAFCAPRIEPEIAFRLHRPLRGPGVVAEQVRNAAEAIAPALEVVDSRIAGWDITLVDTIADNASSAGVVLGDWVAFDKASDLAQLPAELVVNDAVADTGVGAAVLGDPSNAIAWLANALARFGVGLEPGQILLPGSFTSAVEVRAGDKVEARFAGLGTVSVSFPEGAS